MESMPGLNKDISVLVQKATDVGWTFKWGSGAHPMLYPVDRSRSPVVVPISPKGRRGIENFKSELRKRGLPV